MNVSEVDVRAELEQYSWTSARWTEDRLIAASPFREDRRPSFFVTIDPSSEFYGTWGDSGALDDDWASGNLVKLLSYLRQESEYEVAEYLREQYGLGPAEGRREECKLTIPRLDRASRQHQLNRSVLDNFRTPSGTSRYLTGRRVNPNVQRLCKVGQDVSARAVTIPWFNPDGTLGNVMYRTERGKMFWYHRGGRPIAQMVYGLNIVYDRRISKVAIVEAPIDAMSIMSAGMMAIATGGTAFGRAKAELIRKSPIKEIIVVPDNDGPGREWARKIMRALSPCKEIREARLPKGSKDANDVLTGLGELELMTILENTESKGIKIF